MSRRTIISLALLLAVGTGAMTMALLRPKRARPARATLSISEALQGDTTGYARATPTYRIALPVDHGPHPRFKTEWWYFTGNLACTDGSPVGYQFTVFRTALTPEPPGMQSPWRTNQLYTAHLAVSDMRNRTFLFSQKNARAAAGLAGATGIPFRAWVEGWEIRQTGDEPLESHIVARTEDIEIDLELRPTRPVVLHGAAGYSAKSRDPDNASFYYSYTRLETAGTVGVQGRHCTATGMTWMDHEWSTSALGPTQVGWDWFALRLSNGEDLMFFQVRDRTDEEQRFVEGTLVAPDGRTTRLAQTDVHLSVTNTWTSAESGATYPSGWIIEIPRRNLSLTIDPWLRDQELRLFVRYWEGAVTVEGTMDETPISGSGYVELTGYGSDTPDELSGNAVR